MNDDNDTLELYFTVMKGQLVAEYGEKGREKLGRTVKEVREKLREAMNISGRIRISGLCSSSVDFGDEYGLDGAGAILEDALADLRQEVAYGIRRNVVDRSIAIGNMCLDDHHSMHPEEHVQAAIEAAVNEAINQTLEHAR